MKIGDKVYYENQVRTIYGIYPNDMVSLCLFDYDDTECDYLVPVKDLTIIKNKKMKPKNHKEQIILPVYYWEDENGQIHYDFEEMADYFENELAQLDQSVVVMCSIENN